jgi:hypothetical protein
MTALTAFSTGYRRRTKDLCEEDLSEAPRTLALHRPILDPCRGD